MSNITDDAWIIITETIGLSDRARHFSCLYFAIAASSVLNGSMWRFTAGGAFLPSSDMNGWGVSISQRDSMFYVTADREVDAEDGSYIGHCWIRFGGLVIDIMEGYYGPAQNMPVVYHPIPTLTQSIKGFYKKNLRAVSQAARKDRKFADNVQAIAASLLT